tara:strand:+ start:56 stop:850 length:795 start_codon:yes stop_codon:yes gene_type:complete
MKKYLVIGNPVEHSLSPKLHNFWIKQNNIDAIYDKKLIMLEEITDVINDLKRNIISGINVTIPFKIEIIPFLDELTLLAKETGSVNTVYKKNNKIIGDNTDVGGFECAIKDINFNLGGKKAFIIGAGGVAPSIISALKKGGIKEIFITNRTNEKLEILKTKYPDLNIVSWGNTVSSDLIINATSLGLKKGDEIKLDYNKFGSNKLFYDVIYNPEKTNFLINAKKNNNKIENGKKMFVYQAQLAFEKWHNIRPKVDNNIIEFLND